MFDASRRCRESVLNRSAKDIGWPIRKRRYIEQPEMTYSKIPDLICELGRFGQKTGAGYFMNGQFWKWREASAIEPRSVPGVDTTSSCAGRPDNSPR